MVIKEERMVKRIWWVCKYCHLKFEDQDEAETHEFECGELREEERLKELEGGKV